MDDLGGFLFYIVIIVVIGIFIYIGSRRWGGQGSGAQASDPDESPEPEVELSSDGPLGIPLGHPAGMGRLEKQFLGTAGGVGELQQEVYQQFAERIRSRGIDNLSLYWASLGSVLGGTKQFLVSQQEMGPGTYVRTALRLEPISAADLQIELLHYERNWGLTAGRATARVSSIFIGGMLILVVGFLLAIFGIGIPFIFIGLAMMAYGFFGGNKKQTMGFQTQQSQGFYDMVKLSLSEAIDQVRLEAEPDAEPAPAVATTTIDPEGKIECPVCGLLNPPGSSYCNNCGTELVATVG